MTKELLISMYVNALNHANYFKTDRKISWNGEGKELRLDEGVIKINRVLSDPDPFFNIIFFPHVNYAQKNNLGTNAFDFSLSHQEFLDLEMLFDNPPNQRRKIKSKEIEGMTEKNIETTHLQTYERYKKSYPDLSDAEIIERIGNELSDKVETIGRLNTINQELVNQITNQTNQAVWHDADKVFPEFDKNILGYFERGINASKVQIYGICHLESITENAFGKALRYVSGGEQVQLLYWAEIPKCPFEKEKTKNQ